jgi:hypothetical protein
MPDNVGCQSKTFCGGDVGSMIVQWHMDVSVTIPIMVSETHFQNDIYLLLAWDLTFCFVLILEI